MGHWVYGRRTVQEVLNSGHPVRKILLFQGIERPAIEPLLELAQARRIPCHWVPKTAIDAVAPGNHQGVAAEVQSLQPVVFKDFLAGLEVGRRTFLCLLDEIQDPHNLGAILRSAVCFGCAGVVIPKWRSAGVTEAVMKASSGAAAYIPIVEIANLGVAVERLKEKGFFVYGADAAAPETLAGAELEFPLALVMGNEQRGIKPVLKEACDRLVAIPQTTAVASLNVSAAAAVLFYEISRRLNLK